MSMSYLDADETPKVANVIRETATKYIGEARRSGQSEVSIRAGDLVKELGLQDRVPAVCSALGSQKFQRENRVHLERKEGPRSGQSTTTLFTYRLEEAIAPASVESQGFLSLRGLGKQTYAALGGGEAHLKQEREEFGGV